MWDIGGAGLAAQLDVSGMWLGRRQIELRLEINFIDKALCAMLNSGNFSDDSPKENYAGAEPNVRVPHDFRQQMQSWM